MLRCTALSVLFFAAGVFLATNLGLQQTLTDRVTSGLVANIATPYLADNATQSYFGFYYSTLLAFPLAPYAFLLGACGGLTTLGRCGKAVIGTPLGYALAWTCQHHESSNDLFFVIYALALVPTTASGLAVGRSIRAWQLPSFSVFDLLAIAAFAALLAACISRDLDYGYATVILVALNYVSFRLSHKPNKRTEATNQRMHDESPSRGF